MIVLCDPIAMNVARHGDRADGLMTAAEVVEAFPPAVLSTQTLRRWAREGLVMWRHASAMACVLRAQAWKTC